MFIKTVISFGFLLLAVGFNCSYALATSMKHHHEGNSHVLVLSKLNITPSDKSSNKQHYCPVHDQNLGGTYCKMGSAPFNDSGPSTRQKEYFIATDCGGHPVGSGTAVLQIDHKVAAAAISDGKMTLPSFVFTYFELIDCSQGYFNSPEKPPKLFS